MSTASLEERVAALEHELAEFKDVLAPMFPRKNWRDTFAMFADDLHFEEVLRHGREIRQQANQVPNP